MQELKQQQLKGVYWSMKDLEQDLVENMNGLKRIFFIQKGFEHRLMWNMAGLSFIQKQKGKHGVFKLQKKAEFLEKNSHQIFSN
ncbi:DUF771 domain-containing protein [Bacillus sp. PDNC022]|uniref:DUF771 domain-containing protein n=1 Tax=Bacillus sp. PDNC022 TaxID=2812759 RepID=UPI001F070647|nr:DUF771 domain-containing protein [Bacillus sp. PDNC022]